MIPGKTAKKAQFLPNPQLRLREQVREVMRFHHYSVRTEESYWFWIRRFIFFHNKRHPRELGVAEVSAFLRMLRHHLHEDNVQRTMKSSVSRSSTLPDGDAAASPYLF